MQRLVDLWTGWLDRTLCADIRSDETPDPVPMIPAEAVDEETPDAFDQYRYGRGDGEYLYLLYFLDGDGFEPADVSPVYVGETTDVTSRLYQHFKRIRDAPSMDAWTDDGSRASWSKYDHMSAVCAHASQPLYAWILDVDTLDVGPLGYPTYRQELEATLVHLVHSQARFDRCFANREFVPNRIVREMGQAGPNWVTGETEATASLPPAAEPDAVNGDVTKAELWHEWVSAVILPDLQADDEADPIPLFETDDELRVQLGPHGGLERSDAIDRRIRREGSRCVDETGVIDDGPNGLLYVMYQLDGQGDSLQAADLVPRYIGKAEAYGKTRELSANFAGIATGQDSTQSFARWGDGDYWHVGELSNTVLDGGTKKETWASELFEQGTRRLQAQLYLWVRAWEPARYHGPYGGAVPLAAVEPLLIGLAYDAYPAALLNHSGVPDDAPVKTTAHSFESPGES